MGIQFSVEQLAEYLAAGIRARALASRTPQTSERLTGQRVKEILVESCRFDDNGGGLEPTSKLLQCAELTTARVPPVPRVPSVGGRLSVSDIARGLGIGRMAVYSMLEKGLLPGIRIGRRWLVTRHAYEEWERTCGMPTDGISPSVGVQ